MARQVKAHVDEVTRGHRGRCLNAWEFRNSREMVNRLRNEFEGNADVARFGSIGEFELLAIAAGKSPEEYARQHSMLGLWKVAARSDQMVPYGSPDSIGSARRWGMVLQVNVARLCETCIESERVPIWHRSHHILGVDWCIIHGTPLRAVEPPDKEDPYESSPSEWLSASRPLPIGPSGGASFRSDAHVERYAQISVDLLNQTAPAHCGVLYRSIMERAKGLGAGTKQDGPTWLREQLNSLDPAWRPATVENLIRSDSRIWTGQRNGFPGSVFAILLALITETPADALNLLAKARVHVPIGEIPRQYRESRGDDFWFGDIWRHFVAARGNVSELRRGIGGARSNLIKKLEQAGLTSLTGLDNRACWDALLDFSEGASLSDACRHRGVARRDLEHLLRIGANRLVLAVRHVRSLREVE